MNRFNQLALVAAVIVLATPAHAAGELGQFNALASGIVTFLQGIGLTISAIGFIIAGIKYNSGDQSAKDQAKNAIIGSAMIAGAVVLAQFVKGFFV